MASVKSLLALMAACDRTTARQGLEIEEIRQRKAVERPSLAAIVDLDSRPCQHCGAYVLGSPAKCPHCAKDFDGRPRLGSAERPHDCRERVTDGWEYIGDTGQPSRWIGLQDPSRPPEGDGWVWRDGQWYGDSRNGGVGLRSGGKIGSGSRDEGGDDVAVAVPDERQPSKRAPILRLLGYLIRQWLRAWVKALEGRR